MARPLFPAGQQPASTGTPLQQLGVGSFGRYKANGGTATWNQWRIAKDRKTLSTPIPAASDASYASKVAARAKAEAAIAQRTADAEAARLRQLSTPTIAQKKAAVMAHIGTLQSRALSGSNTAGTTGHAATVTALYAELFGRAPDVQGLAFWVSMLAEGKSTAFVRAEMKKSAEYLALHPAAAIAMGAAPGSSRLIVLAAVAAGAYLLLRRG